MLKLIIADDERVIRETISQLIDWKKYDIEVIGLCSNGLEAYDMILDESPDIVLTDIRMPGMNGLELIEKIYSTTLPTQFIILSGYGEFEYAKAAMQYGVKYYLLKPCNEQQIIDGILHCRKDYYDIQMSRKIQNDQFLIQSNMLHNVVSSIINDRISQDMSYEVIFYNYAPFIDFTFTPYKLFHIYYLELSMLQEFLNQLKEYVNKTMPQTIVYGIYVNNVLLLFFQNMRSDYSDLTTWILNRKLAQQEVSLETDSITYGCLSDLLTNNLDKLKRFSMIYYINNFHAIYTCNYNSIILQVEELHKDIISGNLDQMDQLIDLFNGINNIDFLKQVASSLLLKMSSSQPDSSAYHLTEWLIEIQQMTELSKLQSYIFEKLEVLLHNNYRKNAFSTMTTQIRTYVQEHLNDPDLTLKYIAENYLYMNVDYVSKKFNKETGQKFSQHLTQTRIERAKELIALNPDDSIQSIAEKIGCSNNPQYFSQLFKKQTGITPSEYILKISNRIHAT